MARLLIAQLGLLMPMISAPDRVSDACLTVYTFTPTIRTPDAHLEWILIVLRPPAQPSALLTPRASFPACPLGLLIVPIRTPDHPSGLLMPSIKAPDRLSAIRPHISAPDRMIRAPDLLNLNPLVYRVVLRILNVDSKNVVALSGILFSMNRNVVAYNRSPVRCGQERCLWSGALFTMNRIPVYQNSNVVNCFGKSVIYVLTGIFFLDSSFTHLGKIIGIWEKISLWRYQDDVDPSTRRLCCAVKVDLPMAKNTSSSGCAVRKSTRAWPLTAFRRIYRISNSIKSIDHLANQPDSMGRVIRCFGGVALEI
ncbi:hypothetical protein ACLOJK_027011, partial [Asimina triloba]